MTTVSSNEASFSRQTFLVILPGSGTGWEHCRAPRIMLLICTPVLVPGRQRSPSCDALMVMLTTRTGSASFAPTSVRLRLHDGDFRAPTLVSKSKSLKSESARHMKSMHRILLSNKHGNKQAPWNSTSRMSHTANDFGILSKSIPSTRSMRIPPTFARTHRFALSQMV